MDEQLVLTAQTLRLNPDLQRADLTGELFVVKNVPARRYLTVSLEQWNLLRNFANPATVPDVLRAVILNRTCLPLREYYELVLKAYRAGVLQVTRQSEPEARARRWWISVPAIVPIVGTVASLLTAVYLLILHPFPKLGAWPNPALVELLIGWGLLIAGVSLGQLLAASVLHAGGGEVYDPKFRLLRPVPYFSVSLNDACMTSRWTQAGIWCAQLFPVLGSAAALWYYAPSLGVLHVIAFLVVLRPFSEGGVPQLLSTLCRGHLLDTQKNFLFSLNQRWHIRLKFGLSRLSVPYLAARLGWGLAWIALLAFICLRAMNQSVRDVFGSTTYWREVASVFAILAGAVVIASVGAPATRAIWTAVQAKARASKRSWKRWRVNLRQPPTLDQIAPALSESLLFRRVAPAERNQLLQVSTTKSYRAMSTILRFHEKSSEVGLILSGKVMLYRRTKSGRADRAVILSEGDVFGAHALLDPERQQVQLRTMTPVVALTMPIGDFERTVVRPLGAGVVNDLVHKVPFLRRVSFCASWHPQAIARFAQLASIISYNEGDVIVAERQESQQFYVVYEGLVQVKHGRKVRARLKPGAFFGEVSILQNSAAVSDVIAKEPTRCLAISRVDFLRFVTHNPLVSLQLEEISSQHLGRPVFPLSAHSFDVR